MANEVGSQNLESKTDESKEIVSYKIKNFKASLLPLSFRNVIIAPFLNSLRYGNDLFKLIDKDIYYSVYGKYVELLMNRPNAQIKIALLEDEIVLGWSLSELKTLHYIWIKKDLRRQGIAKTLLPKEFDTISHITNKGLSIWATKFPEIKFNPF